MQQEKEREDSSFNEQILFGCFLLRVLSRILSTLSMMDLVLRRAFSGPEARKPSQNDMMIIHSSTTM